MRSLPHHSPRTDDFAPCAHPRIGRIPSRSSATDRVTFSFSHMPQKSITPPLVQKRVPLLRTDAESCPLDRSKVGNSYVRMEYSKRTYRGALETVTPTELRANIYKLLEEVLETGIPLQIRKGNKRLRIVPVEKGDKFQNSIARPEVIAGDPEELVQLGWENEVNLDLP